jgi:two-component system, OmpR family, phosphate regulon sensor histidine kinase PhoR
MKSLLRLETISHKIIAIILGVLAAILNSIVVWILGSFSENITLISYLIFTSLFVFLIVYIVSFFIIQNFIIQKIKPIYKTIQTRGNSLINTMKGGFYDDVNIIKHTDKEVAQWAKMKSKEIEELRRLEKYRKEYVGDISHELKTPIFSIQGYVLTLLDGGIYDPEINIKYLERAEKSIDRLISIVNDLEEISKLESSELNLEYSNFDICELVKEIFESQELTAKKYNITLRFKTTHEKSILVNADRARICQLFTNLISNSIKYGKRNGTTKVSFYDMDEMVLIEVTDDGIGIKKEDLTRIFERFYRADKSRSREQGGTGLGLSIVKHIVEAHGQTINVKSEIDKGSTFSFTLKKA